MAAAFLRKFLRSINEPHLAEISGCYRQGKGVAKKNAPLTKRWPRLRWRGRGIWGAPFQVYLASIAHSNSLKLCPRCDHQRYILGTAFFTRDSQCSARFRPTPGD